MMIAVPVAAAVKGDAKGARKDYQPVKRWEHSTVRVGDYLYMWSGNRDKPADLPYVHNNERKKSMCSVMEVCHLSTGKWEQKPTTGNPPLGVVGYAAAAIGNEIFYFGGYCHHEDCHHNSLYSFNVDTFNWKELSPTTSCNGPRMKAYSDMTAIKVNSEDYLAVIGGWGPSTNTPEQPGAQYSGRLNNEIHFYKPSSGDWISPTVTGDRPPPMHHFTLTSIDNSSAILFGGETASGDSNNVYILNFSNASVDCLESNPGRSVKWPKKRRCHSSVLINTSSGPHLLVLGGVGTSDLWIFDIENQSWKELFDLPENVSGRYRHSLSLCTVTLTTNWIIVFGGGMSHKDTPVYAVIELRYTGNNDWSSSIIPLGQYQEKLQERRREWEALQPVQPEDRREIDRLKCVLQERERELQEERRENEQLRNRLQLQGREQQLHQAQQQGQERERQARKQEQNLQQQLQEKEQELQREIQQGVEREQGLQRQLQQAQQQLQESQERERVLEQQLKERDRQERESSWVVSRNDITMTERILGRGGWGEVRVARFHGLEVAAKVLLETIISEYNVSLFSREMNIASKIRHPNLLQFIGATTEGNPIILTELMPTSLRKELETGGLAYPEILRISLDVACALNYLHLFKPHPILHRDVSSANVLLQPMGVGWRAKVSDYGSANLQHLIIRSVNPGGPLYAAPEAANPRQHSPSMDVFSYGVLLLEMITRRIPLPEERVGLIDGIRRASFRSLVQRCLIVEYRHRPTMNDIITELNDTI